MNWTFVGILLSKSRMEMTFLYNDLPTHKFLTPNITLDKLGCQKVLMEQMIYIEIYKILSFEKIKLITKKSLCPHKII